MTFKVAVVSDIHAYTSTPAGSSAPSHLKVNDVSKPAAQHPLLALHTLIGEQTINADYLICPGDLCDKADTQAAQSSAVTSKPANDGHLKTGQWKPAPDQIFL